MPSRKRISVIMTKIMTYPEVVLDRDNPIGDATNKAIEDFHSEVREVTNDNRIPLNIYSIMTIDVVNEPPFVFHKKYNKGIGRKINGEEAVRLLALAELEEIYGKKIDPDISPDLFDIVEDVKKGDKVIRQASHRMKKEVEHKYNDLYDKYWRIIGVIIT